MSDVPSWVSEILADGRATRAVVEGLREDVQTENKKVWIAIRALKQAIKNKPSKFITLSNSKLAIALIGALIPASVSVYALSISQSAASNVQATQIQTDKNTVIAKAACEALNEKNAQEVKRFERARDIIRKDPNKSKGEKVAGEAFYINQIKNLPDVKC